MMVRDNYPQMAFFQVGPDQGGGLEADGQITHAARAANGGPTSTMPL